MKLTTMELSDAGAERDGPCPMASVADLVFSRWTAPILWMLHTHGRLRFVELEQQMSGISPKVLTRRLRQLERDGLVHRRYFAEVPPRVEYEISSLGESLIPLFDTLAEWSPHLAEVDRARTSFDHGDHSYFHRRGRLFGE